MATTIAPTPELPAEAHAPVPEPVDNRLGFEPALPVFTWEADEERFHAHEPGIYLDVPEAAYHASETYSRSELYVLAMKTPAHLRYQRLSRMAVPGVEPEPEETRNLGDAFTVGSAFHCFALTPELSETAWGILPPGHKATTNDGKATLADFRERYGRNGVLRYQDAEQVVAMVASAKAMPAARHILFDLPGVPELTLVWREFVRIGDDAPVEITMRCRLDRYILPVAVDVAPGEAGALAGGAIVDLKSTRDASEDFMKGAWNYGYVFQEAVYRAGCVACGLPVEEGFVSVLVEKEPPYLPNVVRYDQGEVADMGDVYGRTLALLARCITTDTWPGYLEDGLPCNVYDLPRWANPAELVPGVRFVGVSEL